MSAITLMVTAATLLLLRATRHYDRVCRNDPHLFIFLYLRLNSDALQQYDLYDAHFIELGDLSPRNLILLKS